MNEAGLFNRTVTVNIDQPDKDTLCVKVTSNAGHPQLTAKTLLIGILQTLGSEDGKWPKPADAALAVIQMLASAPLGRFMEVEKGSDTAVCRNP